MANKAIPDLTAASALTGAEQVHVVQGANSRRSTTGDTAKLAPAIINFFIPGKLTDAEMIGKLKATHPFRIPQNLSGSYGDAEANATGVTTFVLRKNGTQFGSMAFAGGAATATLVAASNTDFAVGDEFTITGPATADATLADICLSIKASWL